MVKMLVRRCGYGKLCGLMTGWYTIRMGELFRINPNRSW